MRCLLLVGIALALWTDEAWDKSLRIPTFIGKLIGCRLRDSKGLGLFAWTAGAFRVNDWMARQIDPDAIRHVSMVSVWGRWFVFLVVVFEFAYRPGFWYYEGHFEYTLLLVPLMAFNGLAHTLDRQGSERRREAGRPPEPDGAPTGAAVTSSGYSWPGAKMPGVGPVRSGESRQRRNWFEPLPVDTHPSCTKP